MMRRPLITAFLVLILLILTAAGHAYDPDELLAAADEEIFIRPYYTQDFSENQGYVNEFPNEKTIHQYFIYNGAGTDRLVSLLPAETGVRTTNKRLSFPDRRMAEFHITYSVRKTDAVPFADSGTCWIRFSNVVLLGDGNESGMILYPGDQAYMFTPDGGEMNYQPAADLSVLDPEEMNRFDFIRLDGITYVYANGEFLFSLQDNISEIVSFEAGAELFEGGNIIRCDFDDFSIRIR